ncbi:DUF1801 domain-containing protein [Aureimonas fodinaquatilis]|uniref:DUF1801 domain-containing protein n=1 Tax=Aureimonas fodinaquatilis TaxID=2565783 RepID=A0A5B0DWL5_9HYPH|nr:DUF1801 domain-containing protein [Aureimonas fodinaquatilis]KAA0970382.1 DUF1801 domain-containing protein [Aureimonas fodinaquatilis]
MAGDLLKKSDGTALLSGGNPQIAKGYGNAPVQQFIAAMPGWKHEVGRRLDELIVLAFPDVEKAVKWNSPLYGTEKGLWFLSFHCMTRYIKVAFFRGSELSPIPPVSSKQAEVRYLHIHENEAIEETQFLEWISQASRLPGVKM